MLEIEYNHIIKREFMVKILKYRTEIKFFIVGNVQKQADRNKIILLKGKEKIDSSEPKKIAAIVVDKQC